MATSTPTAENINQKRMDTFEESKFDPYRKKYGLFSFTGTLAISKSSFELEKASKRVSKGVVMTNPKNVAASSNKSGKTPDVYFNNPGYISLGDPYKDPAKPYTKNHLNTLKIKKIHGSDFKYAGKSEKPKFEYQIQGEPPKSPSRLPKKTQVSPKKPAKKDSYANTSPAKSSNSFHWQDSTIKQPIRHIQRNSNPPFVPSSISGASFNDDKSVFGSDVSFPEKISDKKKMNVRPFVCSQSFKTFSPFPKYIPDPPPSKNYEPDRRLPIKIGKNEFSVPTPSISTMKTNLKSEYTILRNLN